MIKRWIKEGKTKEALEEMSLVLESLERLNRELILLNARFTKVQDDIIAGAIGKNEATISQNKVNQNLYQLFEELTKQFRKVFPEHVSKRSLTSFQENVQTKLENHYEILFDIAVGNTAVVYKAKNRFSGRFAAIRALKKQDLTQEPSYQKSKKEMLEDEELTQQMFQIRHRHVIKILGAYLDGFPSCVVTDYISGATSLDKIVKYGARPLSEALDIVQKIGSALHYIHNRDLIHGKIKTAKILIDLEGQPMISPIELFSTSPDYYDLETLREDVQYGSPEILLNEKQDPRSDQFSLALVGYELIAGFPLFRGKHMMDIFHSRDRFFLDDTYRKRLFRNLDAPRKVQQVLEKMLRENRDERFPTVEDALEELAKARLNIPDEIKIVRKSYWRACSRDGRLIREFLKYLFERNPEYRSFFPEDIIDNKKRQRVIRHSIPLLFSEKGEYLPLKQFFSEDTPIKLSAIHYRWIFQCLIEFLQKPENDPLWDEEVQTAWQSLANKVIERIEVRLEGEE